MNEDQLAVLSASETSQGHTECLVEVFSVKWSPVFKSLPFTGTYLDPLACSLGGSLFPANLFNLPAWTSSATKALCSLFDQSLQTLFY